MTLNRISSQVESTELYIYNIKHHFKTQVLTEIAMHRKILGLHELHPGRKKILSPCLKKIVEKLLSYQLLFIIKWTLHHNISGYRSHIITYEMPKTNN